MSAITNGSLQPTWFGHVTTARDALILFEACLNGTLHHVPRRPHDRERGLLIKSGCVFIYEENASGIKRWTDGVPWSPSRILGNFLVYRELMKPFPPGEKKRATKKSNRPARSTKPGEPYPRSSGSPISPTTPIQPSADQSPEARETERALIGSLVDSYGFKEGGLVKKTMSVNVHGVHHHLVSYYTMDDALNGKLMAPSTDPRLANIEPRHDLVARQSFRAPLDDNDDGFSEMNAHHGGYSYTNGYGRSDLLLGGQMSHSGQLSLGYSSLPLSSSAYSSGLQSYAPGHSVSSAYYPPTASISTPMKQESYGGYNNSAFGSMGRPPSLSLATERRGSAPHPQSHYPYRQGPQTPQSALPALVGVSSTHDSRSHDSNSWDNRGSVSSSGHGSLYSTTPTQSHSNVPLLAHTAQWSSMINSSHSLPRLDSHPWPNGDSAWSLDHSAAGRQASFPAHNA